MKEMMLGICWETSEILKEKQVFNLSNLPMCCYFHVLQDIRSEISIQHHG